MVRTGPCAKLQRPVGRAPGAKHDPPTAGSGAVGWKAQLRAGLLLPAVFCLLGYPSHQFVHLPVHRLSMPERHLREPGLVSEYGLDDSRCGEGSL